MKAAAMIVRGEDDKILVIKRSSVSKNSLFGLPAGKVEDGESFHDAAIRETFEETNVSVLKAVQVFSGFVGKNEVVTFLALEIKEPITLVGNPNEGTPMWGTWSELIDPSVGAYHEYNKDVLKALFAMALDNQELKPEDKVLK